MLIKWLLVAVIVLVIVSLAFWCLAKLFGSLCSVEILSFELPSDFVVFASWYASNFDSGVSAMFRYSFCDVYPFLTCEIQFVVWILNFFSSVLYFNQFKLNTDMSLLDFNYFWFSANVIWSLQTLHRGSLNSYWRFH